MKIRVLGSGWYGCHIAIALQEQGHDVEVHEIKNEIFSGASGSIPARLHRGFHYPRSASTRTACNQHYKEFMAIYGEYTHSVPVNIYAIAQNDSLVDFETYKSVLKDSVEFITVEYPEEFGVYNVEGALLTGERHIVVEKVREYFTHKLSGAIKLNTPPEPNNEFDWTIDATFCANEKVGVDRYEPCLVVLLEGNIEKAITIMDGPFPSLYPWNEEKKLCSLSSAKWTPFSKTCKTYKEARDLLDNLSKAEIEEQAEGMIMSMEHFFPEIRSYKPVEFKTSIRAMPLSGSDARLVEVAQTEPKTIRIRAGKIDAVVQAEEEILHIINS